MQKILEQDINKREYVLFVHSWVVPAAKPFSSVVTRYVASALSLSLSKSLPFSLLRLV